MKKFLAIVMCLAMALSMMTVVSFAADITVGGNTVEAAPGEVVDIPVYVNADIFLGMTQLTIVVPEDVAFEAVKGAIPGMTVEGNTIILFDDAGITFTPSTAAVTIKATAPAAAGAYEIVFDGDNFLIDENYDEIAGVAFNPIVLDVKAAVVEPEVEVVEVPVDSTEEGGIVTVMAVTGAPTAFGVEYAGVKYPSAATAEDLAIYDYFAVELIGADADGITTYAE